MTGRGPSRWRILGCLGCVGCAFLGLGAPVAALLLALAVPVGLRAAAALRETADREEAAPRAGRFLPGGDVEMYVEVVGAGPTVLLVSGTGGWSGAWRGTGASLGGAGYRSVAVDLPPFGYSERPVSGAYRRVDGARRLLAVLDALGPSRAVLACHSFGAGGCVEAALLAPDRVAALVLVDPALGLDAPPGPPPLLAGRWPGAAAAREVLVAATLANPLATRPGLRLLVADPADADEAWAAVFRAPLAVRGTTPAIARWLPELLAPDPAQRSLVRAEVAGLPMPVRLVWGSADEVTPPNQGDDLVSLIPGARLLVLDGLGHLPQLEDPATFDRTLVAILDALPRW